MKIAVVVGVYNEEKHIADLLEALLNQNRLPDEIVIVDDGSKDKTAEIIKDCASKNPIVKYIYQKNSGPAAARNNAWKNSTADICIFTDGDCVPEKNWIQELIKPLDDEKVGGVAGAYKTINKESILARFIGLEIEWRYSKVKNEIQAHGTYNLAVRKKVLEEIGGLDESYPVPSGEDWDMTYKISKRYELIFVRSAVVGHYHPEKFWWYMKNQVRRAFDRIKVYKDHPEMKKGDNYTPPYTKYQILSSGLFVPSLILFFPLFKFSFVLPIAVFLVMMTTTLIPFPYFLKKDIAVAFYSIPIQIARGIAWFVGILKGIINFGL
jgi:glycosyltransferase involved in cell wall biosynthesis